MFTYTAELVPFPGCPEPSGLEPNETAVRELGRLLEMAKRGELVGFAISVILIDGATQTQIVCEDDCLHRCVASTALVHRYALDRLAGTSLRPGEENK